MGIQIPQASPKPLPMHTHYHPKGFRNAQVEEQVCPLWVKELFSGKLTDALKDFSWPHPEHQGPVEFPSCELGDRYQPELICPPAGGQHRQSVKGTAEAAAGQTAQLSSGEA